MSYKMNRLTHKISLNLLLYAYLMGQTIHFVRHGEVHNPEKILYGLQPWWRLSERGQQMA